MIPTIQGVIVLFGQAQNGSPLAVIEAASVTALRTAAASGLATDLLARGDAQICAIIGSGIQAESHAAAMLSVRKLSTLRIFSRTPSKVTPLVKRLQQRYKYDFPNLVIEASPSIEAAVKDADIICTVTASASPILFDSMVKVGAHINAVGSHGKEKREIDGALMKRSSVWADLSASTLAEGGDFLIPIKEGLYDESHLQGDLPDLVSKKKSGRKNSNEITVFNSLGIAIEDLQCAIHLYHSALSGNNAKKPTTARLMSRL
jgi:ornithine cyclodeaminase